MKRREIPRFGRLTRALILPSFLLIGSLAAPAGLAATNTSAVAVAADAHVDSNRPDVNYGSRTSLYIDGGPNQAIGYLAFDLTSLAGQNILDATLRLVTTSGSTAGTNGTIEVRGPVDQAWDESTVTFANHPAVGGTLLGTTSGTTRNEIRNITLSVASLQPMLGTMLTVSLSITSADGAFIWSGEFADPTLRPELTVTIGEPPTTTTTAPTTTTTIPGGVSGVVDVGVVASSDDAEELPSGWLDTTSSDLELVKERTLQTVGIRFQGITIPPGATIDSAWVQFTVDEVSTGAASLTIRAHDTANPATFSGTRGITTRPLTATAVAWTPAPWPTVGTAGNNQRTPDLSPLIQTLITRGDWAADNAIALIITGSGTRTAESFDGTAAPRLHITWHTGGTTTTQPTTSTTTTTSATTTTTTTSQPPTTTTTTAPTVASNPSATTRLAVIGDFGGNDSREQAVADMIDAWGTDAVVTVGDNVYWSGGYDRIVGRFYHQYMGSYEGAYGAGSSANRFFPALGNHDYTDGGLGNYLAFFHLPGAGVPSTNTSGNERYYDARIDNIHVFVINSNLQEPDGLTPTSTQGTWLRTALAASNAEWKIVVFHHPPFSSIPGAGSAWMRWPFREWGADLVLSGHAHTYERLRSDGLDYVISGLGMNNERLDNPRVPESQVLWSQDAPGALFIVACAGALEMEYRPVGYGVIDTYTIGNGSCP